jgi:cytochrome c oxidase subunit IV
MTHIGPGTYYKVFGALIVLTAVTVAVSFANLGFMNVPIALAIAVTKATLVVLFFMHVRYATPLVQLFVGAGFFWLGILLVLTMSDYISRGWLGLQWYQ